MDADDGLKVIQNEDKTFALEWDKEDPKWSFLNNLKKGAKKLLLLLRKQSEMKSSMDFFSYTQKVEKVIKEHIEEHQLEVRKGKELMSKMT